jgi:hypothetical protein
VPLPFNAVAARRYGSLAALVTNRRSQLSTQGAARLEWVVVLLLAREAVDAVGVNSNEFVEPVETGSGDLRPSAAR